jgi:hypothetical protein
VLYTKEVTVTSEARVDIVQILATNRIVVTVTCNISAEHINEDYCDALFVCTYVLVI